VSTIDVLDDGDGVISDYRRNFYLFSVNSSQEMTFLGLYIASMLENIVIALGKYMVIWGISFFGSRVV